jgi:hypothetical protein
MAFRIKYGQGQGGSQSSWVGERKPPTTNGTTSAFRENLRWRNWENGGSEDAQRGNHGVVVGSGGKGREVGQNPNQIRRLTIDATEYLAFQLVLIHQRMI